MRDVVLTGWKAISEALGRNERSARRYATRRLDPLPAYRHLGVIVVAQSALLDWKQRQMKAYMSRPKGGLSSCPELA